MQLIGLNGAKGSGKDTVASFVQDWAERRGVHAARRGFADKLKLSACRIFYPDCDLQFALEWANKIKDADGEGVGYFYTIKDYEESPFARDLLKTMSGRQYLQRYGTESHRDVFGEDFWVDQLLPVGSQVAVIKNFSDNSKYPDFALVTDVRFVNEARRVAALDGVVWEVVRPGHEPDGHASEERLPPQLIDATILNDGTLEDLREQVNNLLDSQFDYQEGQL